MKRLVIDTDFYDDREKNENNYDSYEPISHKEKKEVVFYMEEKDYIESISRKIAWAHNIKEVENVVRLFDKIDEGYIEEVEEEYIEYLYSVYLIKRMDREYDC